MKKSLSKWGYKLKNAHKMARRLTRWNGKAYHDNLSICMKIQHMMERACTIIDINYLMNELGSTWVKLSALRNLSGKSKFQLTGGITEVTFIHFVESKPVNESIIGHLISQDRKAGISVNLD